LISTKTSTRTDNFGKISGGPNTTDRIAKNMEQPPNATSPPDINVNENYEKDGVVKALHWIEYQKKLLLLFMIQGSNKGLEFRIATNRLQAGKFDDIEFQFDDQEGK
jgi:hypothetical protein